MTSIVGGSAWERTPWHATQRAAWEALTKASLEANWNQMHGGPEVWDDATLLPPRHRRPARAEGEVSAT
jgi:hypothetical protein